jgi:hypothetical protein
MMAALGATAAVATLGAIGVAAVGFGSSAKRRTPGFVAWEEDTPVAVVFRRFKDDGVIALFPEIPADDVGLAMSSYMRVGEHGPASWDLIARTRPASMDEPDVKALYDLLTKVIGYRLIVRRRITSEMSAFRRASARGWNVLELPTRKLALAPPTARRARR